MTTREHFERDHAKLNAHLTKAGAVITETDGFQWIDSSKVSAQMLSTYRNLMIYGAANGMI